MIKICEICKTKYETKNQKSKYCCRKCYLEAIKPCNNSNNIDILDSYAIMHVYNKRYGDIQVKIDINKIDTIKQYRWYANYDKTVNNFYICSAIYGENRKKKVIRLHRLIVDCPQNYEVDHINRDTKDNRMCNLRICTRFENQQNLKNNNDIVGVSYSVKRKMWAGKISKNNKVYRKDFKTKEEAIAYRKYMETILYKGGDD